MLKKILISLFLVLSCGIFSSCAQNRKNQRMDSTDVFAMDTYMTLKACGENTEKALSDAAEEIHRLENIFSVTLPESDINRINNGFPQEVGDDTLNVLNFALEYGKSTDGALDITIYPVLKLWGFTTGDYKIPEKSEIDSLLENVDYSRIKIDGNTVSVPENSSIDLGALAKGYTGDRIIEIFRSYGIESAIISLGGNVQALGRKPDDSKWKVSVRNPFSPDEDMCILSVDNKAVVTSGNYERYFEGEDGNLYWHIIDPSDGYPADNGIVSATVIGVSGLMCDSLSTAFFVMGKDKAEKYYRENDGFDMILVTDDRKIFITEGISENFENISGMSAEIVRK